MIVNLGSIVSVLHRCDIKEKIINIVTLQHITASFTKLYVALALRAPDTWNCANQLKVITFTDI